MRAGKRDAKRDLKPGLKAAGAFTGLLWLAAAAIAQTATPAAAPEPAAKPKPPILEAETSSTATLPPVHPYRLFLASGDGFSIIDAGKAKMEGTVHGGGFAVLDVPPDQQRFYVAETHWTRGNRGERTDMVSVYDTKDLKLQAEIKLPSRLIAGGRTNYFSVSADGKRGFVFNLDPATAVHVVDLEKNKFLSTVEIPGCGLAYPFRNEGFATLCADGSLATVMTDARGRGQAVRSEVFFDGEQDPVFEESIVDRTTGEAFLVTLTGKVFPVKLGAKPEFGTPWHITSTAGLAPATTGVQHKTWRAGGRRPFAYHRESGTLFVLMHEGKHWSHYDPGTEVWAIDARTQALKGRFQLPTAGSMVGVSQGKDPLLYVTGTGDWLWIMDPVTGKIIRQMDEIRRGGQIRTVGF